MTGISDAAKKNPKRFGVILNQKTKQKNIPQTVKLNSTTSSDGNVKCNMFNAHFHSSFSACYDTDAILSHIDDIITNFLM